MTRTPGRGVEEPPGHGPLPLPSDRKLLARYYAGERLPSPMGGQLELLAVKEGEDGEGMAVLECNISSLRYVLTIPKATRTERRKVREVLAAGRDPSCPRHGPGQRLVRVRKDLRCPLCGVAYARAP